MSESLYFKDHTKNVWGGMLGRVEIGLFPGKAPYGYKNHRAHEKKIEAFVKRKLVEIVSSNHILRNGSIEFQYRKPFDILAKSSPKENWWT